MEGRLSSLCDELPPMATAPQELPVTPFAKAWKCTPEEVKKSPRLCMTKFMRKVLLHKAKVVALVRTLGPKDWAKTSVLLEAIPELADFDQYIFSLQEAEFKTQELKDRVDALAWVGGKGNEMTSPKLSATFILGPSSSGKSFISRMQGVIQRPYTLMDGALLRESLPGCNENFNKIKDLCNRIADGLFSSRSVSRSSFIWQMGAVVLPKCLGFGGFKDMIDIHKKTEYKIKLVEWYKNISIVIPTTAQGASTISLIKMVQAYLSAGRLVNFVAVCADLQEVEKSGAKRALLEGKMFDSKAYASSFLTVGLMHSAFAGSQWVFLRNYPESHRAPIFFNSYTAFREACEAVGAPKRASSFGLWR